MKIQIIIGSIRQGRKSDRITKWIEKTAADYKGVEFETLDLQDFNLPLFDEPVSPRYNPNRQPAAAAQKWLTKLAEADGYIIVTPEYNHSIPGALKNALDYPAYELQKKPVAIVSHGFASGARAAEHLKGIISELQAVVVPPAVAYSAPIAETISDDGTLAEELAANPYGPQGALKQTLDELVWYAEALAIARSKA